MTYIYLGIIAFILIFMICNIFEEKDWKNQVTAGLVIIPLILRLFMLR